MREGNQQECASGGLAPSPASSSPTTATRTPSQPPSLDGISDLLHFDSSKESEATATAASQQQQQQQQQHNPSASPTQGPSDAVIECWICRGAEETAENPMIHGICRCVGSIGHVHRKCIHRWLRTHGDNTCPSCKTPYTWETRCRKVVPYPESAWDKCCFVLRHFFLPLLCMRLAPLVALYVFEWLVQPMVVGAVFYGKREDWWAVGNWWQHVTWFRLLEMWLVGAILLLTSQTMMSAWKAWRRFFASYHSHAKTLPEALPIDDLDRVYYEAAVATAAAAAAGTGSRQPGVDAPAAAHLPEEAYQDANPGFPVPPPGAEGNHDHNGNRGNVPPEEFSSDTESATSATSSSESFDNEDAAGLAENGNGEWTDTDSSADDEEGNDEQEPHDGAPRRRRAGDPEAAPAIDEDDNVDEGEDGADVGRGDGGNPENEDADGERHDDAEITVNSGPVSTVFQLLDKKLERRGRWRRLRKLCTHRLASSCFAALVLRSMVGVCLVLLAFIVAAVVVRRRFPRRKLRNVRRRFDEMVANCLRDSSQVTATEKRVWFATLCAQMFLFSFLMPAMGGLSVHYVLSPFLLSAPGSLSALLASLNIVRLVIYWVTGTVSVLVLMTMEASVMVPLFAPGVDLFFIRAIDQHMDLEQLYYELILAQIYDTDPLGVLSDFFLIAPVEVAALLCFLAFPVWTAFGLREVIFGDLSEKTLELPMPLLMTNSAPENMEGLPSETPYRMWVQSQLVYESHLLTPLIAEGVDDERDGGREGVHAEHNADGAAAARAPPQSSGDEAPHAGNDPQSPTAPAKDGMPSAAGRADESETFVLGRAEGYRGATAAEEQQSLRPLRGEANVMALLAAVAALANHTKDYDTLVRQAEYLATFERTSEPLLMGISTLFGVARPSFLVRSTARYLNAISSWKNVGRTLNLYATLVRVIGQRGGSCRIAFMVAAHDTGVVAPHLNAEGEVEYQVKLPPPAATALRRRRARSELGASGALQEMATLADADTPSEDHRTADNGTAVLIDGGTPRSRVDALDLLRNTSRYDCQPACVGALLEVLLRRLPVVNRAASTVAAIPLRFPLLVLLDIDSTSLILALTALTCLFRFPLQRLQLQVLRPVCHYLAEHVVHLEWFLFDEERDELLAEQLAQHRHHAPIEMPILPVQRQVVRRTRYFHPNTLPPNLMCRLAVFSVLFLVVATALSWAVPVCFLTVILSIGDTSSLFAISASLCAMFFLWNPKLFVICCSMACVMPVGGVFLVLVEISIVVLQLWPSDIVQNTWNHVSQAEKVLVPYPG